MNTEQTEFRAHINTHDGAPHITIFTDKEDRAGFISVSTRDCLDFNTVINIIHEGFNVTQETGLTPRQLKDEKENVQKESIRRGQEIVTLEIENKELKEQRDELLKLAEECKTFVESTVIETGFMVKIKTELLAQLEKYSGKQD